MEMKTYADKITHQQKKQVICSLQQRPNDALELTHLQKC